MTGLIDAVNKKLFIELLKADIRRCFAPNIAEDLCRKIDAEERAEHLARCYDELMNMFVQYQKQQQQYMEALYRFYYEI